uniref:Fe2OG dioxygenase domain-containing protein n=1 Tax=Chrysotila carterae TaxID=13221 RepID=A0A7S4BQX6_CHRCT
MCTASSTQNQPLSRLTTFQYKAGEDLGLDMHTDACDVTLNVCLGKEFVGAGLTLCGLRGAPAGSERRFVYRHAHVRGKALMHLGHHRHGADDIVSGERYNLIMWNKNSTYRLTREFMGKYMQPPSTDRETPDLVCLSYTHDDDYETYKKFPEGKRPRRDQGG